MNIKQAKARFTELTGLPAKRKSVFVGIRRLKGHHSWFMSFAEGCNPDCDNWHDIRTTAFWEKYEFYLEQISHLQEDVARLTRDSWRKPVEYFTDDQVASYVGARVETVKEWRLGLRKPRGSNICSLIEEFELDYGRWRKRG